MDSAIKYPGGLNRVAPWIVDHFPPHVHYVEPFFGSGAVLFARSGEGVSEVVNDIDGELINFWRVLRDQYRRHEFIERCLLTPFSDVEFAEARLTTDRDEVSQAWAFFVRNRMSYMGTGKGFAAVTKSRTRRGMNEQVAAWMSAVDRLPEVAERLSRVLILNADAVDVIKAQDGPGTLFFLDPPWVQATRTANLYRHEYTDDQHRELIATVKACRGRVCVVGYDHDIYAGLGDWSRHTLDVPADMQKAAAKSRRTLTLWCNYGG